MEDHAKLTINTKVINAHASLISQVASANRKEILVIQTHACTMGNASWMISGAFFVVAKRTLQEDYVKR